jgi:hypothetical protein
MTPATRWLRLSELPPPPWHGRGRELLRNSECRLHWQRFFRSLNIGKSMAFSLMRWNPELLEHVVAPGIGEFTEVKIPDLTQQFPQANYWLVNHFLNNALNGSLQPPFVRLLISLLRRSRTAFGAFHSARKQTNEYLSDNDPITPNVQAYYDALFEWETFILQSQIAMEAFNRLMETLHQPLAFQEGDGSIEEKVWELGNRIKHHKTGQLTEPVPIWLSNHGIKSAKQFLLSYEECSEFLARLATVADELQAWPVELRRRA